MFSFIPQGPFRHLFAAQVIALFGTGLTSIALALLAYELAEGDAGLVLGFALALKMVAYVIVSPLAGVIAPFIPRSRMLVTLDILRAGAVLCLPFVDSLWQVYLLIFLLNTCSALFTPTFQATIPDILPDEKDYTQALSLSRLAYDLENLLSPTLAALLLTVLSFDVLFSLNAVAFVVSALLIVSVTLPAANQGQNNDSFWYRLTVGSRIYFRTPALKALMALNLAISAVGAMQIVNTVVYVRSDLGLTETLVPLAFAAAGIGSISAAVAVPWLLKHYSQRLIMLTGSVLMGGLLLAGTLKPDYYTLLILWCLIGFSSSLVQTPIGLLLRSHCQEEDRPALFAAHFSLSHACWLICYPLAGWLGAQWTLTTAFGLMALLAILATLVAIMLWPRNKANEIWHEHGEQNHEHLHFHDEHHQHSHEGWEGPEPHSHNHQHQAIRHQHKFVIDRHHRHWPY